jgi:hypothetical protein
MYLDLHFDLGGCFSTSDVEMTGELETDLPSPTFTTKWAHSVTFPHSQQND